MKAKRHLRYGERMLAWMLLGCSLFVCYQAAGISGFSSLSSPGAFPLAVAAILLFSAGAICWENRKFTLPEPLGWKKELQRARRLVFPRTVAVYITLIIAYMLALVPLHFLLSSYLFLVASMLFLRGSKARRAPVVAAGILLGIYLVFRFGFKVVLP